MSFNPYYRPEARDFWISTDHLVKRFDLGSGHFIQRLQRTCGLQPELVPHGCLVLEHSTRALGRTALHFQPGPWAIKQRSYVHPRAREVYPSTTDAILKFIRAHSEMHFVEVGTKCSELPGVEDWTGLPLADTIRRMATCEYFIGINSGPMHVAAALGLKIVNIINFPDPSRLYLPTLKVIDLQDLHWLYPQSVLLHQDGEGPIVRQFSLDTLERAIAGELYPYWSTDYLDLIFDPL